MLIADIATVSRVLGRTVSQPRAPESMNPREAKLLLTEWIKKSNVATLDARMEIARSCDLDRVKGQCRSFEELLGDLAPRRP